MTKLRQKSCLFHFKYLILYRMLSDFIPLLLMLSFSTNMTRLLYAFSWSPSCLLTVTYIDLFFHSNPQVKRRHILSRQTWKSKMSHCLLVARVNPFSYCIKMHLIFRFSLISKPDCDLHLISISLQYTLKFPSLYPAFSPIVLYLLLPCAFLSFAQGKKKKNLRRSSYVNLPCCTDVFAFPRGQKATQLGFCLVFVVISLSLGYWLS